MPSSLYFNPPVIAHRGGSAYAPENTMAAFVKAAQLGIKWVEFDVMLSACNQAIVFHDEILDRTTNAHGAVSDYTYAYLSTLDAGSWFDPAFSGERIPKFVDLLQFLDGANMQANVEIKPIPGQDRATAVRVWQDVQLYKPEMEATLLFSSFSLKALQTMRTLSPTCQLGLLMHHWLPDWQAICDELNCVSVNVNQEIMTAECAKKIKNTQRSLLCYTVNQPERARELFAFGVDAVFSDVPDKIIQGI